MLDRSGGEAARATSIVRYAPGARFDRHVHGGGEEILVLEGVFSDETGDHPAGTYLRNPPGSAHAPFSREGCVLFVKLWQFTAGDTEPLRLDTRAGTWRQGLVPGLTVMPLHSHDGIDTALVRWAPHTRFQPHTHPGGEEILVLQGVFFRRMGPLPAGQLAAQPALEPAHPLHWGRRCADSGEGGAPGRDVSGALTCGGAWPPRLSSSPWPTSGPQRFAGIRQRRIGGPFTPVRLPTIPPPCLCATHCAAASLPDPAAPQAGPAAPAGSPWPVRTPPESR